MIGAEGAGLGLRGGPEVNKFEQVSNLNHQMSLANVPCCTRVQCMMVNGHMGTVWTE